MAGRALPFQAPLFHRDKLDMARAGMIERNAHFDRCR